MTAEIGRQGAHLVEHVGAADELHLVEHVGAALVELVKRLHGDRERV